MNEAPEMRVHERECKGERKQARMPKTVRKHHRHRYCRRGVVPIADMRAYTCMRPHWRHAHACITHTGTSSKHTNSKHTNTRPEPALLCLSLPLLLCCFFSFFLVIDELRIWNVARSDAEVTANWNLPIADPALQPTLSLYYAMDAGVADVYGTSLPTSLADASGNANKVFCLCC